MKNLILLVVVAALSLSSCSGDDSTNTSRIAGESEVTFFFDGFQRTYTDVHIAQSQEFIEGNENYILVLAGVGDTYVRFTVPINPEGTNSSFKYIINGTEYGNNMNSDMTLTTTVLTDNYVEGTFSGIVANDRLPPADPEVLTIANGSFKIHY